MNEMRSNMEQQLYLNYSEVERLKVARAAEAMRRALLMVVTLVLIVALCVPALLLLATGRLDVPFGELVPALAVFIGFAVYHLLRELLVSQALLREITIVLIHEASAIRRAEELLEHGEWVDVR